MGEQHVDGVWECCVIGGETIPNKLITRQLLIRLFCQLKVRCSFVFFLLQSFIVNQAWTRGCKYYLSEYNTIPLPDVTLVKTISVKRTATIKKKGNVSLYERKSFIKANTFPETLKETASNNFNSSGIPKSKESEFYSFTKIILLKYKKLFNTLNFMTLSVKFYYINKNRFE